VLNAPTDAYTQRLIAAVPHLPNDKPPRHFTTALLTARHLSKTFDGGDRRAVHALKNVSLMLSAGETLGIVGESGSGKSTLGRTIVGLEAPDGGSLMLGPDELVGVSKRHSRSHRREIQMVFQDPYASLNPRHRVGDAIAQGPIAFGVSPTLAKRDALLLLNMVGLGRDAAQRYPHQFSGGQRQRIGIARALALKPRLLIADEPVSALDVSIQAQILRLLAEISREMESAVLFITHDLRVAAQICDRIAVMQQGEIVEIGYASDIFFRPRHAYTRRLIDSIPGKGWQNPTSWDDWT
jgi:peptide/nickel transport system ATP-binding protein